MWEAFKNCQDRSPSPAQLNQNLWRWDPGIGVFFQVILNAESHWSNPGPAGCPSSQGGEDSLPRGPTPWKEAPSPTKYVSGMHVITELVDTPSGISLL